MNKLALMFPLVLAVANTSCVNGKLSPIVSQVASLLDTTGCELVTVYVADQEAGDVCKTASTFFNGLLSTLSTVSMTSAPASMVLPKKAALTKPPKFPVKYQGVTAGHFYAPYASIVQAKLDGLAGLDAGPMMGLDGGVL